jgi:hypothetical protein
LLAVAVRQGPVPPRANSSVVTEAPPMSVPPVMPAEDESLTVVARLASGMSFEELQQVARPTPDATDAFVAQMSPKERAELVRLIKAEKGSSE